VIALDTNVLARYLVRDDPRQTAAATKLIESACTAASPGVVTLIVFCELVWVLERGYRYRRVEIARVVRQMLAADELQIERSELAWQALNLYEDGKADYADYLIGLCGREQKSEATFTFDTRTSGSDLFRLLKE
jgi:predicted nucleic-acid-binding protein